MDSVRDHFLHFFTPRHTNNHRSRFLHPESLLVMIALLAIVQIAFRTLSVTSPGILGIATNITVDDLMFYTNQERSKHGLNTLIYNPVLAQAAEKKAQDMFRDDYWAHNAPDGATPWDFIISEGYSYTYAGENLARDFNDSSSVVAAWMNSPSHRDNIVKQEYREIGFAVVNGTLEGQETTLVVQMFGTPQNAPAQVSDVGAAFAPRVAQAQEAQVIETAPEEVSADVQEPEPATQVITEPVVDEMRVEKSLTYAIAGLLLTVLIIDGFIIWRRGTLRIAGHNMAHFIFLLAILGLVILGTRGSVLGTVL